nr:MAG TPA: hypothetical protein [Caudoviricetes sp.]
MADLISRKALLEELDKWINPCVNYDKSEFLSGIITAISEVETAPAVDAAPTAATRWTEGMTMIKGKYVATIELNFNVDESTDGLLPFETLQAKVTGGELDKAIVAVISDEFGELCSVGLNKQYADLYLVDGGHDNE